MAADQPIGAEKQSGPPPDTVKANAKPTARPAPAAAAARAAAPAPAPFSPPPQGEGVPRRLFSTGSPQSEARLNVAMKVLRDPVARMSFSRPYSGQSRYWGR
jgi:hypothetical protein